MKWIIFLFVGSSALFALPVTNIAQTVLLDKHLFLQDCGQIWNLKCGYRGDLCTNRKMRNKLGRPVQQFSLFTNEGVLTLNLWERVDLYGLIGSSNYRIQDIQDDLALNIYSKALFTYGVGLRATVWAHDFGRCGITYVGVDAQYEKMPRRNFDRASSNGAYVDPSIGYRYRECQIAIAAAQKVGFLCPYVALKWSQAKAKISAANMLGSTRLRTLKSQHYYGMAVGTTLISEGKMDVTAEYRFIEETGFCIFGEIKF